MSPLASALLARLPRRPVLVTFDVLRLLVALALPWVNAIWQVYVLIFLLQASSAAFTPTFQATIPDVLPKVAWPTTSRVRSVPCSRPGRGRGAVAVLPGRTGAQASRPLLKQVVDATGWSPEWLLRRLGGRMQGALRSAFLARAGLSKEVFIATGVVIAVLIDFSRIGIYAKEMAGVSRHLDYAADCGRTGCLPWCLHRQPHSAEDDDADRPGHSSPLYYSWWRLPLSSGCSEKRLCGRYSGRSSLAFIRSISACCDVTILRHNCCSSGSLSRLFSHIRIAPAWCGIIERRN